MKGVDLDEVNELVEHPEYFLTGTLSKQLAWSIYFPLRLVAKRNEYVQSLKIPSIADHKASGLASAAGTIAGLAAAFTLGVGFKYTKGTDGFVAFKDCPLIAAKIIDYDGYSKVHVFLPYNENSKTGEIRMKTKGFYWKNKTLSSIEIELKDAKKTKVNITDEKLLSNIREFFDLIVYWSSVAGKEIKVTVEDVKGKKYNIAHFTLVRPGKKGLDFLIEQGKDVRKIPELVFEISKGIYETHSVSATGAVVTPAAIPPKPIPQPQVSSAQELAQPNLTTATPPVSKAARVSAQLQAPRGTIPIASFPQTFGREDFRQLLPPQLINLVSRRHFMISYDPEQNTFYIQDLNSTNGTYVNGVDIRGKGLVPLKNGDLIVPANVIPLKFVTSSS
jgi:hypothetical protein